MGSQFLFFNTIKLLLLSDVYVLSLNPSKDYKVDGVKHRTNHFSYHYFIKCRLILC